MYRFLLLVLISAFLTAAHAETVKGRIAVVSQQAGTIRVDVKGKDNKVTKVVVRTDANTRYEGSAGLKELGPPDLIEV